MNKKLEFYAAISKVQLNSTDKDVIVNYVSNNDLIDIFIPLFEHKIQYLLFKHLMDLKIAKKINRSILKLLNIQFSFLQFKHKEWIEVLKTLVSQLNAYNLNYALLKGIGLSNELYTICGLNYRDYNDIDVLIEKKDVQKLNIILEDMGFVQGDMNDDYEIEKADRKQILYFSLNSHQEKSYIKFSKYSAFSPLNRLLIDVNTTIFEGGNIIPRIDSKVLLSNTTNRNIDNFNYKSLKPEYNLIQLCYHFYKDTVYDIKKKQNENYCLIKFCDIREYIIKYYQQIDWNNFVYLVNANDLSNEIYYVLNLISFFYKDIGIECFIENFNIDKDRKKSFDLNLLL